ncbi:unnamed protein product, partial [Phaeothamnion confervicola]
MCSALCYDVCIFMIGSMTVMLDHQSSSGDIVRFPETCLTARSPFPPDAALRQAADAFRQRHPFVRTHVGPLLELTLFGPPLAGDGKGSANGATGGSDGGGFAAAGALPPTAIGCVMLDVAAASRSAEALVAELAAAAEVVNAGGAVLLVHGKEEAAAAAAAASPGRALLEEAIKFLPLRLRNNTTGDDSSGTYLAVLDRTACRVLPTVLYLRGEVAHGYGRGSKRIGVPTANLPESQFAHRLRDLPTGVYFGWAQVEAPAAAGAPAAGPFKMVANVGYSPTFMGEENREKIVEAHLIGYGAASAAAAAAGGSGDGAAAATTGGNVGGTAAATSGGGVSGGEGGGEDATDFYGSPLRLLLVGFQREERRFGSFGELVATIRRDIIDAAAALDAPPYSDFRRDAFFASTAAASGRSRGGNNSGSSAAGARRLNDLDGAAP